VERPSPSERATAAGSDDGRESVRDDIGMDGKWEHHRICKITCGCGSTEACAYFVYKFHYHSSLTAVCLPQLRDVARGLVYMHGQGIVHGDLKGVRI